MNVSLWSPNCGTRRARKDRPNLVEWWSTRARELEREDAISRLHRAERDEFEPRNV
jgi:hypothetical protein